MIVFSFLCSFLTGLIFYYCGFCIVGRIAKNEKTVKLRERLNTHDVGTFEILKDLLTSNFCCKTVFSKWTASAKLSNIGIFNNRFVFINDVELAKEAFYDHAMCGRIHAGNIWGKNSDSTKRKYGIMHSDGPAWTEQNRFVRRHLKYFGVGTKSMETKIMEEVTDFINFLSQKTGQVIYPVELFPLPVLNSLWFVIGGGKYSRSDNEMTKLIIEAYECAKITTSFPDVISIFWKLPQKILPKLFNGSRIQQSLYEMRKLFKNLVEEHRDVSRGLRLPNDFIDAYLNKIDDTDDPESSFYGDDGAKHLVSILADFFIAGGDTTSTMLSWAVLHLVRHPQTQRKIQSELDLVIGRGKQPTLADRPNCSYTEAFIMETLRLTPVGGTTIPHAVTKDGHIGSLAVRKNTIVFLNIGGIQCDPKIWEDPESFKPERFLDTEGKCIYKHEAMVAFSVGKRRCPGEQLARDNLFLIFSSICHRFHIQRDPHLHGLPPLAGNFNLMYKPNQFGVVLQDRDIGSLNYSS